MNNKHYFLFIVKNISCVQFSSCHTSDENFLTPNFPNYDGITQQADISTNFSAYRVILFNVRMSKSMLLMKIH